MGLGKLSLQGETFRSFHRKGDLTLLVLRPVHTDLAGLREGTDEIFHLVEPGRSMSVAAYPGTNMATSRPRRMSMSMLLLFIGQEQGLKNAWQQAATI